MIAALLAVAFVGAIPVGLVIAIDLLGIDPRVRRRSSAIVGVVAGLSVLALTMERGTAAAMLTVPWWLVAATVALGFAQDVLRGIVSRRSMGEPWRTGVAIACGFLAVGATWLVVDRAAIRPFGFDQTIALLTAVHFHVAGFVLTLAGSLAAQRRPGIAMRSVVAALVVGMPLTALGFFGFPLVSWIGALLVAVGGLGIGLATVAISRGVTDSVARPALLIAGSTLFLTMPLAAAYATGTTFGIGFFDIPAMAAIHGGLNVVSFAIPAMVGWWRLRRGEQTIPGGRP